MQDEASRKGSSGSDVYLPELPRVPLSPRFQTNRAGVICLLLVEPKLASYMAIRDSKVNVCELYTKATAVATAMHPYAKNTALMKFKEVPALVAGGRNGPKTAPMFACGRFAFTNDGCFNLYVRDHPDESDQLADRKLCNFSSRA